MESMLCKDTLKSFDFLQASSQEELKGEFNRARAVNNVGIIAAEVYFPCTYISQAELEKFDGVSNGKYTVGLGQEKMAVATDLEDVNSICLTAVSRLLERTRVEKQQIGRLEVGTETIQDKSKSVKSYLMQLFEPENTDIGGVDNVNACYGGTAALLNSIAWMESKDWDGRLALVVAGDIAVYGPGPARPTGGAGAVALLIGPDAPVIIERGTTAHHMCHTYDFYKPSPSSEYPIVDGTLSVSCYLQALEFCYQRFLEKFKVKYNTSLACLRDFDYFVFHCPYYRLVQRAFGRLYHVDFLKNPHKALGDTNPLNGIPHCSSNEDMDKKIFKLVSPEFETKVGPTCILNTQVGNCYSASLYVGLISLLATLDVTSIGKRIGLFSYGSGLASTMFSIKILSNPEGITRSEEELIATLEKRRRLLVEEYTKMLAIRERQYLSPSWSPSWKPDILEPGTYYLEKVDELYRRTYLLWQ